MRLSDQGARTLAIRGRSAGDTSKRARALFVKTDLMRSMIDQVAGGPIGIGGGLNEGVERRLDANLDALHLEDHAAAHLGGLSTQRWTTHIPPNSRQSEYVVVTCFATASSAARGLSYAA